MRSINKVILIGNLTRDPELRETPSNQKVATFGLATNRAWMTKEGEKKTSAEFHECVAWARLAEICAAHLKKGTLVYVEGYLKTRSWEGENGEKKFKTEVVMQDMIILEKKSNGHMGENSGAHSEKTSEEELEAEEAGAAMAGAALAATIPALIASNPIAEAETSDSASAISEAMPETDDHSAESNGIDIDADLGL